MWNKRPTRHSIAVNAIIAEGKDWDVPTWKEFRSQNDYWNVMKKNTNFFGNQSTEFKELKLSWMRKFNRESIKY